MLIHREKGNRTKRLPQPYRPPSQLTTRLLCRGNEASCGSNQYHQAILKRSPYSHLSLVDEAEYVPLNYQTVIALPKLCNGVCWYRSAVGQTLISAIIHFNGYSGCYQNMGNFKSLEPSQLG